MSRATKREVLRWAELKNPNYVIDPVLELPTDVVKAYNAAHPNRPHSILADLWR